MFGLSDTEIDTYLALLSLGEAPTRAVAEEADVTQRAVYGIAERLERRGLVRVKEHASPTTISALPPKEAIANLSSRLEALTPSLEERFEQTTTEAPEIQIIKSRETVLKRLRNALSEAETEALVAIPDHVYPEIEAELRAAVDRGVLVFLLLGETVDPDDDTRDFTGVADVVRSWDASIPFLYTVDNEAAMIGDPHVLSMQHNDKEAVTISQPHLTSSVLGMYLSAYWPVSTIRHVTEPDSLPASYDWFREAVLQAFLHWEAGHDFWADIVTESGAELSGKVSDVRQAFVEPSTNDFTLETSLHLETDDGEVSVGGPGAFIEDYRAEAVTLRFE
ncbi:TrmB family transcriptional regulator [Halogranum amylolyticum]|uniref:TrmB family transcriptional regulator n=1 Tax=Halogranum amylolyticum TaxID=660520 RepID=UPI001FCE1258|nr:TrmB family transcriptional regulator sugar-binding domain-containing protein [Halogranum amylolyticum]